MKNLLLVCFALPLALSAQAPATAPLPKAETILDRYVEATGGKAAYEKRHSLIQKGTMEMEGRGVKGTLTNYMAPPAMAYSVVDLEGVGQMEEGSNGEVAWEKSAMQGPRVKEGMERTQALEEGIFNSPILWREIYTKVETKGSEAVEGEDCWKVEATPKSGSPETLYFSKKSGLELKRVAVQSTQMGDIQVEALLSGYEETSGVLEPTTLRQKFAGQEMVFHIEETQANADIPASRFALPDDIQALLKKAAAKKAEAKPANSAGGKFTIYMSGAPLATETYTVEEKDGKYTWSGSGEGHMGPMTMNIELYRIVTDDKYRPYEAELKSKLGQVSRNVKTTFADGKARNETAGPNGPQVKEDVVNPNALVIAFPIPIFPLNILARRVRFDTKDPQEFHAYLLGQKEVPVTAKYTGKETVEFAGKTAELEHVTGTVEVQAGQPLAVDIWTDEARKIIKLAAQAQHIEAYQEGYEPKPEPTPKAEDSKN